jgi:capsular exopolysaccharide synthesis family protein
VEDIQRIVENVRLMAKGRRLQVIGITSAVPNEGTSTLATAMALMMTADCNGYSASFAIGNFGQNSARDALQLRQQGTLLIDTQWRHPSVHDFLDMPMECGLGELLTDEVLPGAAIKNLSVSGLRLITAGQKCWNPSASIEFEKFKALISYVKSCFEFVVLDLPPVLQFAEAIPLSQQCDGLVLVVRANHTRWEIVAEAKRLLQKSGVNILGAVLNRRKFHIPERIYRKL